MTMNELINMYSPKPIRTERRLSAYASRRWSREDSNFCRGLVSLRLILAVLEPAVVVL